MESPRICLVIPCYIKASTPSALQDSAGLVLLRRALESLRVVSRPGSAEARVTLGLVFYVDAPAWDEAFDVAVRQSIDAIPPVFPALVFTEKNLQLLKRALAEKGVTAGNGLSVSGYANIRNAGLLVSQLIGADLCIFMDNDEVVEEPDYLKTASEYVGGRYDGKRVCGKGGFYVSADGRVIERKADLWWQLFWGKNHLMNAAMERIVDAPERLVETPIVLGGNLVLHRDVFSRLPFDPGVPRGEDIDYLINAKRMGFEILFDRKLRIRHLHPERDYDFRKQELKGDIERFLYEHAKTKGANIPMEPYPGYFLRYTRAKAMATIVLFAAQLLYEGRTQDAKDVLRFRTLVLQKRDDVWGRYLRFRAEWEQLMQTAAADRHELARLLG